MKQLAVLFILFIIYSFIGWCMEVANMMIRNKKFVNRGFLIGPLCPIYGCGAVFAYIILEKYLGDPIVLFIMSILLFSLLEYSTSFLMEKLFHARWWDYTNRKFNINGRICLETMIPFGLLGMLSMYIINPFFIGIITSLPDMAIYIISGITFLVFLADNIISFCVIKKYGSTVKHSDTADSTEEFTELVHEKFLETSNVLKRRLLSAFPHAQSDVKTPVKYEQRQTKKVAKKRKKS